MKIVINRLSGKAAEAFTGDDGNGIRIEMPAAIDRRQYGKTRRSSSHPRRPQLFLEYFRVSCHNDMIADYLDSVKKKIVSRKGEPKRRIMPVLWI